MRRILPIGLLLLSCALLVPATAAARSRSSYRSSTERVVFQLLNTIRRQHHLPPFTFSAALRASAREHSADMLAHQYFEHDGPNETFDHRIRRHLDSTLVGENIAWGTGKYSTPEGLVQLWMHSPTHRHIILLRELRRIGLGVAIGTFEGSPDAAMATADFAA
ncbi:MAG TPA: CAP domain-containing protein [Gaiellales bacterium]